MKTAFKPLLCVILATCALAVTGCAPALRVNVLQPAHTNLGSSKRLSVVQMEGRRSAKEAVAAELVSQARAAGYFQVTDRTEEGITVKVMGRSVAVSGGNGAPQAADEIGARIDVLDWSSSKDSKTTKDSKGNEKTSTVYVGKVVLGVTAFNAKGKAPLAEKEFIGNGEGNDEDDAMKQSLRSAVSQLLTEITPTSVERAIRMDDDDEAQKPIIELARTGAMARAVTDERALVASNPNSGPAVFNLAVLLDASGSYEEALGYYDQALKLANKDYYAENRTSCAKRLADAAALAE